MVRLGSSGEHADGERTGTEKTRKRAQGAASRLTAQLWDSMFKSVRVATVATTTLSALAFLSASATSLAAIRAVEEPASPVLLAPSVPQSASDELSEGPASADVSALSVQQAAVDNAQTSTETSAPEPSPRSLATLVAAHNDGATLDDQQKCLATAVYFESRSESLTGQLAVARVVINRARSGRFPTTLCGVVTQPGQFSFVRAGRLPVVNANSAQWRNAKAIARIALDESWDSHVEGALFFHATRVAPGWNRQRMAQVGNHVFYR
jgi:N-acetylmuramoyl-L-alanine amidase